MTPNQEYGRRGYKPKIFVIHKTEGSYTSAINWIASPKSQVSYHFIIDIDGEEICLVMPENTAWHAGIVNKPKSEMVKKGENPNLYSIGIALAGFADEKPTQKQIFKCAELLKILGAYYNIPLDNKHIVPHNAINSDKICPGQFVNIDSLVYLSNLLP